MTENTINKETHPIETAIKLKRFKICQDASQMTTQDIEKAKREKQKLTKLKDQLCLHIAVQSKSAVSNSNIEFAAYFHLNWEILSIL